jgi:hypothetical protein
LKRAHNRPKKILQGRNAPRNEKGRQTHPRHCRRDGKGDDKLFMASDKIQKRNLFLSFWRFSVRGTTAIVPLQQFHAKTPKHKA